MKSEYDFSEATRGPIASSKGKTRITIMLDDAVIEAARDRAENAGTGYQTIINNLLRQALVPETHKLTSPTAKKPASKSRTTISRTEVAILEKKMASLVIEMQLFLDNPEHKAPKAKVAGQKKTQMADAD
ncbi:BrnA antitoxin family protein [Pseudomonas sp. 1152_12]|uniref:BrnA antitoxin family protein n=1 Tax=Pseudomonas sp. 1152_12 TaxID=2604455 RepID=UPI004064AF90